MEKRNQILRENKSSVSVKLFSFLVLKSDAPFQTQLKFNISQPPRTNILPPEIIFNLILNSLSIVFLYCQCCCFSCCCVEIFKFHQLSMLGPELMKEPTGMSPFFLRSSSRSSRLYEPHCYPTLLLFCFGTLLLKITRKCFQTEKKDVFYYLIWWGRHAVSKLMCCPTRIIKVTRLSQMSRNALNFLSFSLLSNFYSCIKRLY